MWILFRLICVLIAFAGYRRRPRPLGEANVIDDKTVFVLTRRNKGRTIGYTVSVELKATLWFRLHRETGLDRWFKRIGFSTESETRDKNFDDLVYVACDHPMLSALLKRSAESRRLISELLAAGVTRIDYDGHAVRCSMKNEPSQQHLSLVAQLGKALAPLEKDSSRRLGDPFLWKALVVEGLVWSLAGYGLTALAGLILLPWSARVDVHVSPMELILPGLGLAAALFSLLLAAVWFLLRGSSRGHRVIIESAVALMLGLPTTGIQLFADLNRSLDASNVAIQSTVSNCQPRVTRGRRGRTTTTYHLHMSGSGEGITLPSDIRVAADTCRAATPGSSATVTLGKGAFGKPWYRQISVGGVDWSP
jgi:hypothetical protein